MELLKRNQTSITHSTPPPVTTPSSMVKIYVARHGQDLDNAKGILNGHRNEPLTELGRQQARDVGTKMVMAGFTTSPPTSPSTSTREATSTTVLTAIYSSPLKRAHETAKIFAGILASGEGASTDSTTTDGSSASNNTMEVKVLDDLIERDFGIMSGLPASSILEKVGSDHVLCTETINYFLDPAGAETFPDLIARAKRLLAFIQQEFEEGTVDIDKEEADQISILLVTHGDFGKMIYCAYYNLDWRDVLKQFHFGNSEVLLLAENSPPGYAHVFQTLQFNT